MDIIWILLITCGAVMVHSQDLKTACTFNHDKLTYFCSEITNGFPSMFYGAYNLKCTGCNIPIFKQGTFPLQADIPSLNLSNSGIENITTGAFNVLPKLQYLYLQNNRIYGIEPDAFASLKQLYVLDLEGNELVQLAHGFVNGLDAASVSLSRNHIQEIPAGVFEGVKGIMAFNLSFNSIGILHTNSFKGLYNTEILDLQHNKICYIPLGLFKYAGVLKDLNLKGNKLRSFIPGTLSGLEHLLSINLANNEFSEFDPSVLLPMGNIANLDISRNNLYYLDAHSVHTNAPTLRALTINDNIWSCQVLTNLIQYFKSVNIDTSAKAAGRYDVTNVNGVICSMGSVDFSIPFDKYLDIVKLSTFKSINYC